MTTKEKKINALETKFAEVVATVQSQIEENLKKADDFLRAAEKISVENGVPFSSPVSRLRQNFWPASVDKKFQDLDSEFIESLTGVYHNSEYDGEGWAHSAVC